MLIFPAEIEEPGNPIHDPIYNEQPKLDDDLTLKLQSEILPLDVQLMLVPMWTVRSRYHDCMCPLDKAMEQYMKFRCRLKEIDFQIELGTATILDIATAFEQVFCLLSIYEKNQKELTRILKEVNHQILFYAHASKNDLMWNEMLQLRDIDYISFTRKTCTFEHIVTCLFKLDENLKESIRSAVEISKCCATYLLRISKSFNFSEKYLSEEDENRWLNASLLAKYENELSPIDFVLRDQTSIEDTHSVE